MVTYTSNMYMYCYTCTRISIHVDVFLYMCMYMYLHSSSTVRSLLVLMIIHIVFYILEIVLNPKDSLVLYHPSAHQFFAIDPTHRVSACDQLWYSIHEAKQVTLPFYTGIQQI